MSNAPENLDPKEATEARLCAYLEGELSPTEQAEIEKHLAANPQHRKLLTDLAQTRDWMRLLPGETAPADLSEAFQGQVERSMLLEDPQGRQMTIIRWPQVAMMAAIILLTLGLSVTLVFMLKGPGHNVAMGPGALANSVAPATAPSTVQNMPSAAEPVAAPGAAPMTKSNAAVVASLPPTPAATPAVVGTFDQAAPVAPTSAVPVVQKELSTDEIKTSVLASGYHPSPEARSVCFVIRSDAPANTADQLQAFFMRHQLVADRSAAPVNPAAAAADKPEIRVVGTDPLSPPLPPPVAEGAHKAVPPDLTQTPLTGANQAVGGAQQNFGANNSSTGGGQNSGSQNNRTAATQPELNSANNGAGGSLNNSAVVTPVPIVPPGASASSTSPQQQVFIARNLTPLQLELLNASLAENNPGQPLRRLTLSDGPVQPGVILKGQSLLITVAELKGPGIDKANSVKVADDGTINLPMLDGVPAAGITPDDLRQRIIMRYRDANLIPDATVSVAAIPSAGPSTQPTTQPVVDVSTTKPATQPSGGIDVVVLIEKSDAAGGKAR